MSLRIVVTVKYVPDATGDRHFADDLTVDRDDVDGLLSELDEYAVEQALQIADDADNAEITVLTVGPEDAKDALFQTGASYAELENWPVSAQTFARILADIEPFYANMAGFGEPLIDRSIIAKLAILHRRSIRTSLPTNGTYIRRHKREELAAELPDARCRTYLAMSRSDQSLDQYCAAARQPSRGNSR